MIGNKEDTVIPFQPIRWPGNQLQRRTISIQPNDPGTFAFVRGCTPEGTFAVNRVGVCRQEPTKSGARNRSAEVRVFEVLHVDALRWFHEALVTYPVAAPQRAGSTSPASPRRVEMPAAEPRQQSMLQHFLRPIAPSTGSVLPASASARPQSPSTVVVTQSPALGTLLSPSCVAPLSCPSLASSPGQQLLADPLAAATTAAPSETSRADCSSPLTFAAVRLGATFAEWAEGAAGQPLPLPVVLYAHELFGSAHHDVMEQVQTARDPRGALERWVRQAHGDALVNVVRFGAARAMLLRAIRSRSCEPAALSPLFDRLLQCSRAAKYALSEPYWIRLQEFCTEWPTTPNAGEELLAAGCL